MQLVSVLSISRRIRSCSAAVSTLAILHVALYGSEIELSCAERTGWAPCVMQREPGGLA